MKHTISKTILLFLLCHPVCSFAQLGAHCERPMEAILGENTIPDTDERMHWYSFIMPSSGEIIIDFPALSLVQATLYSGDCSALVSEISGVGFNKLIFTEAIAGETYYLRWRSLRLRGHQGFDWTLDIQAIPIIGEDCERAADASIGFNPLPATLLHDYWYSFTAISDGQIAIESSTVSLVTLYSGDCSMLRSEASGAGTLTYREARAGTSYFIRWNTPDSEGFDWDLSNTPITTGGSCGTAIITTVGTNSTPILSEEYYYWHAFTAITSGKMEVRHLSDNYRPVEVFSGDCINLITEVSGRGHVRAINVNAGETYYIRWQISDYAGRSFLWELINTDFDPGDTCDNAFAATLGENALPSDIWLHYWYAYTATENGKLIINHGTGFEGGYDIQLYSDACLPSTLLLNAEGPLIYEGVEIGQTYYIRLRNRFGDRSWSLHNEPIEAGDNCSVPLDASLGINTVAPTYNPYLWYSFNAITDGRIAVNIVDFEYQRVALYSGECSTLLKVADGLKSVSFDGAISGQTYYIQLFYMLDDYQWTLENTPLMEGLENKNKRSDNFEKNGNSQLLSKENTDMSLLIYPNPVSDHVQLVLQGHPHSYDVIIQDLNGAEVMRGANLTSIDLTSIHSGIYLLIVKSPHFFDLKRIVVR